MVSLQSGELTRHESSPDRSEDDEKIVRTDGQDEPVLGMLPFYFALVILVSDMAKYTENGDRISISKLGTSNSGMVPGRRCVSCMCLILPL